MTGPRARREGFSLIEAMVAVAVLGLVGAVSVGALGQALSTLRQVQQRERALNDASRFLQAVALWPVEDLDRRLGPRQQGDWTLTVQLATAGTYHVVLSDSSGSLLETWLVREPAR